MPRHKISTPYLIHTNRELGLMLKGVKPLAKFVDGEGRFPEAVTRYLRLFDRYVATGRLVRRDHIIPHEKAGALHLVYFALPHEAWRIQAMIDLWARPGPWSREKEREEGELLGYTSEQNDIWMSDYYKGP